MNYGNLGAYFVSSKFSVLFHVTVRQQYITASVAGRLFTVLLLGFLGTTLCIISGSTATITSTIVDTNREISSN